MRGKATTVFWVHAAFGLGVLFLAGFRATAALDPAPAPWPVMRGNLQNTGRAESLVWSPRSDFAAVPRVWRTGNGIFSTPVIDENERIYVGSADHYFYALDPLTGTIAWKFDARELIDSAAALSADGRIYVPAGAAIYALDREGKERWAFEITSHRPEGLYSFSTNYWWEGNVALGPDGNLYAGNDDFFLYSLRPDGALRWAYRTGFLIWSVPAFAPEGTLYLAGFDMRLHALDPLTGQRRWKRNLKNPLVASPALAPDGTLFQGSMDGKIFALDSRRGKIKWVGSTDGHIYGSPALDPHGRVYVASTDGFLYALAGETGETRWTFYTGDAVRSSPALGPDPEGKAEYLIYFGGGQGEIFALEPNGARRWSFDTLTLSGPVDYPNLNASPALGQNGLAIANANGEVFYLPYDYYLHPEASGINRDPTEGFPEEGARWHAVSAGGLLNRRPLPPETPGSELVVHPSAVVTLRLIVQEHGRISPARLVPGSVQVAATPAVALRAEVFGDRRTVALVPEEMLSPGQSYSVGVAADYIMPESGAGRVKGVIQLRVPEPRAESVFLQGGPPAFVITHMAFPQPAIVPSLDQIGIAIMRIPFAVVAADREKKTFVAWAVQKFGASAGGEEQGVPDSRSLFYAFAGKTAGDFFVLESAECFFEASSFPFPLDRLRLAGRVLPDGTVERGASLWAELQPPNVVRALSRLRLSSEETSSGQQSYVNAVLTSAGHKGFLRAAMVSGPTVLGYLAHRVWRPWGLYNSAGRFVAAGTFRLEPLSGSDLLPPAGMEVIRLDWDPKQRLVTAEVKVTEPRARLVTAGILLVDGRTGRPVPLNYNLALRRQYLEGGIKRTTLVLPNPLDGPGPLTAYLMLDLYPARKIEFQLPE